MDDPGEPIYCRRCQYDLRATTADRCPECGTRYDPADDDTFLRSPRPPAPRVSRVVLASLAAGWVAMFIAVNLDPHFGESGSRVELSVVGRLAFALGFGTLLGALLSPFAFAALAAYGVVKRRLRP